MGNFYNCLNRGMYKLRQGNGLFSYFYVYLFHNPFSSPELHFEDFRLASPISEWQINRPEQSLRCKM
jgi:hypothetical protein